MNKKKLPMRIGVGIIVLNKIIKYLLEKEKIIQEINGKCLKVVLIKERILLTAMKRELIEETSIKNIKILKEIEKIYEYELPENLVGIIWKGKFRGQKQKWFITRFLGDENEINLNTKHLNLLIGNGLNLN